MIIMVPALTFVVLIFASVSAIEIELPNAEITDIEILFPKADNPVNSVPSTSKEREQSNRLINFLDRLLNRNQGTNNNLNNNNNNNNNNANNNNNNNNLNLNNQQTVASQVLASTRRSLLSSLIFIPDVNKGVDTILGGVASGNLEQVISGSFIFTPNRVQSVANTVINRVFGGTSLGNLNNNGQNNNNNNNFNNNNNNNNLNKNLNQTGSGTGNQQQQQQFQVLSTALNQINGQNSNEQQQQQQNQQPQQLSASELEQLQHLQQLQNSQLASFENKNKVNDPSNGVNQQLRSNSTASNGGGFTNLLSGVFGQIFSSNPKNSTDGGNANNNNNNNNQAQS